MTEQIWKEKLIVVTCYKFHEFIKGFCERHDLNTIEDFLWYEHNGIISKTYRFLYTAPLYYLVNSKAFLKFYKTLDKDFQNDIITQQVLHDIDKELQASPKLVRALHRIMKEDSKYVYKNS